jgi:deazaflavin-dependent oxidoreductase (nitroreductase family)
METRLAREAYCYLTTTGRRSGRPRRIEIWFAAGEAPSPVIYLLAGGRERAGWVQNLRADPRVTVEIGDRPFAGVARVLEAGAEEATARQLVYEKYRAEDDLEEWRDTALPIAIDLAARPPPPSASPFTAATAGMASSPRRPSTSCPSLEYACPFSPVIAAMRRCPPRPRTPRHRFP